MELLKAVVPLIVPIPVSFYFDIFDGLLQAYVFVFLTSLFMRKNGVNVIRLMADGEKSDHVNNFYLKKEIKICGLVAIGAAIAVFTGLEQVLVSVLQQKEH